MARDRIFYPSIGVFVSNGYVPYGAEKYVLSFDGANDYALADSSAGQVTGAFSLSLWMKSTDTYEFARLMVKDNGGMNPSGSRDWLLASSISSVFFGHTGGTVSHPRSNFYDDQWHHVVGTNGGPGGDLKIYIDGSLGNTNAGNGFSVNYTGNQPVSIGAAIAGSQVGLHYEGLLDEAAIFNKELSSNEVSTIYNNGNPIDLTIDKDSYSGSNNLTSYWRMNEGKGTKSYNKSSDKNLSIYNGTEWELDTKTGEWGYLQHAGSGYLQYTGINLTQDSSISVSFERAEINQIGGDALVGRPLVSAPEVSPSFSYLINNQFSNEKKVGLYVGSDKSIFGEYSPSTLDQKNLSFAIAPASNFEELSEAEHFTGYDLINVGNAFLTNYQTSASVGSIGSTSMQYQAATMEYSVYGANNPVPSINLISGDKSNTNTFTITDTGRDDISFFVPSEISMSVEDVQFGPQISGANIQSFDLSFSVPRKKLEGFGSMHAYNRPITFPLEGQISIEVSVDTFNSGSSEDLFSSDRDYNFDITMLKAGESNQMTYKIHNARLDSNSSNFGGIGGNMSTSYTFSFPITRKTGLSFVEEAI